MEGSKRGDGDPLDICVVTERPISKTEIILNARVVGGLPMLDGGEADDKIIAVLQNDPIWESVDDIEDLPNALVERMRHYFMTYKLMPGEENKVSIGPAYGYEHAKLVIQASMADYGSEFGSD
jgi:inorganic pyrophosphatase